jgi:hypothetical protein
MGEFYTPLSPIDWSLKQKTKKEILELTDSIDLMKLRDVFRVFHHATAQYTFLSAKLWNFLQNRSYLRAQSKS